MAGQCPFCGWSNQVQAFGPLVEDPKEIQKRERRYQMLEAASLIFARLEVFDRPQKCWDAIGEWSVIQAEALLKEIERKET